MAASFVIDASAVVELVRPGPVGDAVDFTASGAELHAPAHVDAESLSAVGRLARAGLMADAEASDALRRVAGMPVERHPVEGLLLDAWELRHNLRLVDALYVALAERLELPLLTTDARLAAAYDGAQLVGSGG